MEADVLKTALPPTDIALAFNFSYFTFKAREEMRKYFTHVLKSLKQDGIFIIDCFTVLFLFHFSNVVENFLKMIITKIMFFLQLILKINQIVG